jgi:hypothetical protein
VQKSAQKSNGGYDDLLEMQDFDDGEYDMGVQVHTNNNNNNQFNNQHMNFLDQQPQFIEGDNGGFEIGGQEMPGNVVNQGEGEEEEESVYIKDNVVMRRIQIEGEDQEYLMDPDGNIYDMQGNFIGTANANELEEMMDDGGNNNNVDDKQQYQE